MKKIIWIGMAALLPAVLSGCFLFGSSESATLCDSIDSCTGCALGDNKTCNDKGTLKCSGSSSRCAKECLHTSGAAQCGHTGCACKVSCGCK